MAELRGHSHPTPLLSYFLGQWGVQVATKVARCHPFLISLRVECDCHLYQPFSSDPKHQERGTASRCRVDGVGAKAAVARGEPTPSVGDTLKPERDGPGQTKKIFSALREKTKKNRGRSYLAELRGHGRPTPRPFVFSGAMGGSGRRQGCKVSALCDELTR